MKTLRDRRRQPTHPGAILREDVLPALRMSQTELAERLGVSRVTVNTLLQEKRDLSVELAARIAKLLGHWSASRPDALDDDVIVVLPRPLTYSPYISTISRLVRAASAAERWSRRLASRSLLMVRIWSTAISAFRRAYHDDGSRLGDFGAVRRIQVREIDAVAVDIDGHQRSAGSSPSATVPSKLLQSSRSRAMALKLSSQDSRLSRLLRKTSASSRTSSTIISSMA